MVEKESVLKHLDELRLFLKDLQKYGDTITRDQLRADRDRQNMVLYAMIGAIQAGIDIGNHLIVEFDLRRPERYRDVFHILREGDILEKELADRLSELVGFRNIAIHIYWRVDFNEVHRIITEEAEALKALAKKVESLIE